MRKKKKIPKLNIKDYPFNAAKNFSFTKILVYLFISLILGVMLLISCIQAKYTGTALAFCVIALFLVFGYLILNIMALIVKMKEK